MSAAWFTPSRTRSSPRSSSSAATSRGNAASSHPGEGVRHPNRNGEPRVVWFNRPAEARPHFDRLLEASSGRPDIVLGFARCRRMSGDAAGAGAALDQALAGGTDDPRLCAERGRAAMDSAELAVAEPFFRQALSGLPADRELNLNMAGCLRRLGRADEAEKYARRALEIDADLKLLADASKRAAENPADVAARYDAGRVCLRNGQAHQAMRWFSGALQVDPRHRSTHEALAEYYDSSGKTGLANRHRHLAGLPER